MNDYILRVPNFQACLDAINAAGWDKYFWFGDQSQWVGSAPIAWIDDLGKIEDGDNRTYVNLRTRNPLPQQILDRLPIVGNGMHARRQWM